ncbi:hypothetical protein P153DRAFT_201114 [Dothidotthia symphoricarpi CBS 119687]|uniref:Uncharacterized protein n=1 Tax=Dothidotthia symphoricarpi CBS 119687 TaxID=1392245 RepID=A0A6A6AIQ6_9PLEO|nr:uncharacterized protein P153DRAFT_201114 [Dothidotthia symphoricarpi CBS 119687]KAF2131690.1 hypothetical protein P153DRAFT_201114 [Dothidotthia symphoricarpi CBS 119687]
MVGRKFSSKGNWASYRVSRRDSQEAQAVNAAPMRWKGLPSNHGRRAGTTLSGGHPLLWTETQRQPCAATTALCSPGARENSAPREAIPSWGTCRDGGCRPTTTLCSLLGRRDGRHSFGCVRQPCGRTLVPGGGAQAQCTDKQWAAWLPLSISERAWCPSPGRVVHAEGGGDRSGAPCARRGLSSSKRNTLKTVAE